MNVTKWMLGLLLIAAPLALQGLPSPTDSEGEGDVQIVFCGESGAPVSINNEVFELANFPTAAEATAFSMDDLAVKLATLTVFDEQVNSYCLGCVIPDNDPDGCKRVRVGSNPGITIGERPNADGTHSVVLVVDNDEWHVRCTKCKEF